MSVSNKRLSAYPDDYRTLIMRLDSLRRGVPDIGLEAMIEAIEERLSRLTDAETIAHHSTLLRRYCSLRDEIARLEEKHMMWFAERTDTVDE